MSNHETALALIEEQIEKVEKDKAQIAAKVQVTRTAADHAEKEMQMIDWDLENLKASRAVLQSSRVKLDA